MNKDKKENKIMMIASRFAGTFYPANKNILESTIDNFLNYAKDVSYIPRAIIVPHAGYIYSGQVAATAYKALRKNKKVKNIVILAPSHHVYFWGMSVPSAECFETPLGNVKINQKKVQELRDKFDYIEELDKVFMREHSLEVQLPFIKRIFPNVKIIPIIVGECETDFIFELIDYLWVQDDVFVVSSDMSHFLPREEQQIVDKQNILQIENLEYENLGGEGLCGYRPVKGIVKFARDKGLKIINIDSGNSADVTGDGSSVVGYASFVVV